MSCESTNWENCLAVTAGSDVGLRRSINQDSYGVVLARDVADWERSGHLLLVADGMGAHAAGELASRLAVDHVAHLFRKHQDMSPPAAIEAAVQEANDEIHRRGQVNLSFHNMGTTCSALLLLPQGALVAHVGDSRVYIFRQRQLHQLTFDHSLVWEMKQAAQSAKDSDELGIPRNVITRSLGPQPTVKVDLEGPFPIQADDTFLLCTDGLTCRVNDREIASALESLPPEEATHLLVNLANLRGGPDNITVIIARLEGDTMVTRPDQACPLTVGEPVEPISPVHSGLWIVLGLSLLLASVLFSMAQQVWGSVMLCIAAGLGLAILAYKTGILRSGGIPLVGGRRLGKAPYRQAAPYAPKEFFERLAQDTHSALDTARSKGWEADWQAVEQCVAAAEEMERKTGFREALQTCLKGMTALVEECRARSDFADA